MIWILEDDDSIRKLVIYALESQDMAAEGFAAPADFWNALKNRMPDLAQIHRICPSLC